MSKELSQPLDDRAAGLSAYGRSLLNDAGSALNKGDPNGAAIPLAALLALASKHPEANRLMGIACQMRGDYTAAVGYLRVAVAHQPNDATAQMNLGSALFEIGSVEESLSAFRIACELSPNMAPAWYNLGKALKLQLHSDEARTSLERALALNPGHIPARASLADLQTNYGKIGEAVKHYREILRWQPEHPEAWYALANLKTVSFTQEDCAQLTAAFRKTHLSVDARISLGFALSKAFEDQGNTDAAFAVLREANRLKRSQVNWDRAQERLYVNAIKAAFAQPSLTPIDPSLGEGVIFIVSLPRSGSTLIEQILASHSQIEGANEIVDLPQVIEDESSRRSQPFSEWATFATPGEWDRLGRDYLARTNRWRQRKPIFTDKNLVSWQYVGAIAAMLPGARIVSCHRDPVETCFACYRQLFSKSANFSYDLHDIADHYLDYQGLMQFWQQLYPTKILDFKYESLLADSESQIRTLLDFCGVPFDTACLQFHTTERNVLSTASAAQVRQPLQKNTSRSGRYVQQLGPLRAYLSGGDPSRIS